MEIRPQEEIQTIKDDQKKKETPVEEKMKGKWQFTRKHLIVAAIILLALGGLMAFLIVYFKNSDHVAITYINQRDDFSQVDEICINRQSSNMLNCTEVKINTIRVTVKKDDQNTTNLIFLKGLKLREFTINQDGSKTYNDYYDQNAEIDQYLNNRHRFLENSVQNNDLCLNLSESECGDVNEFPLLSFITDRKTGQVLQIGIPNNIQSSVIQPLLSSIIHIGANTINCEDTPDQQNQSGRILEEQTPFSYRIGKLTFIPKYQIEELSTGEIVVTKKITKEDYNGKEGKMEYFKIFDQQQDTVLDLNDQLKSSRIITNTIIDNSILSSDSQDTYQYEETQVTSESKLQTIISEIDENLTNSLIDVYQKQSISFFLLTEIEDKLRSFQSNNMENLSEEDNQNDDQNQKNNQGGNRLLDENGDVSSTEDTSFQDQSGDCNSNSFTQKRKLKEVTLLKQKVAVQVEFQGKTNTKDASGYIRTCVTLNGSCVRELQKDDFSYKGKSVPDIKKGDSKTFNIFKTTIILLGYPLDVAADLAYSWSLTQQNIKTDTQLGLQEGITASVSLSGYGQLSIVEVIRIKAGVNGTIFKGNLNGKVIFGFDQRTLQIIPKKYLITLDFQIQALKFDVYAQYSGVDVQMSRQCIGSSWYRVCTDLPELTFTDWKDIYRRSFQLAKSLNTNVIFRLKSKCYT